MPAPITSSETQVNTAVTGDQWDPTVTVLADGGWVVVWMGRVAVGSATGIFGQRYAADGVPVGGEFQVNSASAEQWEGGPAVAALPDGGWIVAWYATSPHGGPSPASALVYTQRYDSTGTATGEVQVNATDGYTGTLHPDVAVLADGGWVVIWHSQHIGTDADEDIYGQRYDSTGAPVGGEFQVSTGSARQHLPSVTELDDGGWLVTWMSEGQDGSGWGVYAQRYNADGSANGGETLVTTVTDGNQLEPHLATLEDGGWVITWHSNGQDGSGSGIYARRYDSSGAPLGGEFQVNTTTANDQLYTTVEALPDGGFAVTWLSIVPGADPYGGRIGNVYLQRYDAAGNTVGGEVLVGTASEGSFSNLDTRLASLADGSLVVTWGQYGTDGSGWGIYARTFEAPYNTINGTEGDDELFGTSDDDQINALAGNDIVLGLGGNDTVHGGEGDDSLFGDGGTGYSGPSGNDLLFGGGGDDFLRGGAGVDYYDGGDGFDRISFHMRALTQGVVASLLTQTVTNDGFGNAESMDSIEGLGDGGAYADHFTGDGGANFLLGSFDDTLIGNGGDDQFQLTGAPALTDGGEGTDTITGFFGDIFGTLVPDGPDADSLAEFVFATGGTHVDLSLGMILDDGFGNSGTLVSIENVNGSGLDDTLIGDDGDNVLSGWAGNDLLAGRGGDDSLDGGDGTDTASYADAGGGVTVALNSGTATGAGGNDTLVGIENAIGSEFDDVLIGNSGDNFLDGSGGNDLVQGGQGHDQVDGGDGNDTLSGNAGNDTLFGGDGDDRLNGNPGDDTLDGGDGDDSVVGGPGNDTIYGGAGHDFLRGDNPDGLTPSDDYIDGGAGFDRATFYNTNNAVTVSLLLQGAPQDTGQGWDTLLNVEAVSGSVFSDVLIGDDNDNWFTFGGAGIDSHTLTGDTISANGGNDLIIVGLGNHVLDGGSGVDTVGFAWTRTEVFGGVTVSLLLQGAAQDTGQGSMTLTAFENLSGSAYDDVLTGDAGDNLLAGNAGSDVLSGGTGNDILLGDGEMNMFPPNAGPPTVANSLDYAGVDFYDADGNLVFLFEGQDLYDLNGNQLPRADLVDEFGDPYSQFTLGGVTYDFYVFVGSPAISDGFVGNDILYGGDGDDTLIAGAGNDSLIAGPGNDGLDGGSGLDTVDYWSAVGPVDLDLGGGVVYEYDTDGVTIISTDTLVSIEYAIGSQFDDALVGSAVDNYLDGTGGNDFLFGMGGNDQVLGGAGNDQVSGDSFNHVQTGGGNDLVDGGDGNDAVRGRDGDDTVLGGAGNDFVEGGTGDDYIDGGAGFDRAAFFSMATGGVTVDLNLQGMAQDTGQGWDTLVNIENLSGTAFADTLIGDGGDNAFLAGLAGGSDTVIGNGGNDLVEVGAGNHILSGGDGIDTLSLFGNSTDVSSAGVTVSLALQGAPQDTEQGMMNASGFENLSGSLHDDTLTGNAIANIILGDGGSDLLAGGDGNDTLYGDGRISVDYQGVGTSGPITLFSDTSMILAPGVAGNDTLLGGKGNDILHGGGGNDSMTGGAGADRYVIEAQSGSDLIIGFAHVDRIVFDASSGVDEFSDLVFTAVGKDTLISWGSGDSILVEGFKPKELSAADFEFGLSVSTSSFEAASDPKEDARGWSSVAATDWVI